MHRVIRATKQRLILGILPVEDRKGRAYDVSGNLMIGTARKNQKMVAVVHSRPAVLLTPPAPPESNIGDGQKYSLPSRLL